MVTLFPKDKIVVGVSGKDGITDRTVDLVRRIREKGYAVALDNFIFQQGMEKILEYISIVNISFFCRQELSFSCSRSEKAWNKLCC